MAFGNFVVLLYSESGDGDHQISEERRVKNVSHIFQSKATSGKSEERRVKNAVYAFQSKAHERNANSNL